MKNKVYFMDEIEQGFFSFEGKTNKITLEEIRSLQSLQPESIWILLTQPETELKLMEERQKNSDQNED